MNRSNTNPFLSGTARITAKNSPIVARTQKIAQEIAAKHSVDVDANSRFPIETIDALRKDRLLSAAVPHRYGGGGAGMSELAAQCATLAQGCGASAMVLAMHHIQVACIARHGDNVAFFQKFMEQMVEQQLLIASVTSENGTFGDTRTSICAVNVDGERFSLDKDATTISYGQHADSLLITCRRNAEAAGSDQVLVLAKKGDYRLDQTGTWDTLGMRGTRSPGFKMTSVGDAVQIIPGAYADSSAMTMVPYSHILWASLWWGIAADAVAKASAFVRAEARKKPGVIPPNAQRLAEVQVQLQTMRHNWMTLANEFDEIAFSERVERQSQELTTVGWALKMNNLKISSSEMAPQIVHKALQIIGILGYKNDSPFSVGRHYRDVLSASLMVANDRILARNASMLLVFKDD
jgi:acyl-CoA dehydrogenase